MPISILSWNIKSLVSCVQLNGNHFTVIQAIMNSFDIVCIYEVPNSKNGENTVSLLVNALNKLGSRSFQEFHRPTLGLGNENDQIAVLWDSKVVSVKDTSDSRRPDSSGGRQPIYFNVEEVKTKLTMECCAWHAPEPSEKSSYLIAQGWQNILKNAKYKETQLTALIMGDFNGDLTVNKRGNFVKQINSGSGTTLKPFVYSNPSEVTDYLTTNTYDQFFVNKELLNVDKVGIYYVMKKLAENTSPFTNVFGSSYGTLQKAYNFYKGLSDHLPVAIVVKIIDKIDEDEEEE